MKCSHGLCTDVDECQSGNGGCEQSCTNTVGSFYCNCTDGFLLGDDLLGCDGNLCSLLCDAYLDLFFGLVINTTNTGTL